MASSVAKIHERLKERLALVKRVSGWEVGWEETRSRHGMGVPTVTAHYAYTEEAVQKQGFGRGIRRHYPLSSIPTRRRTRPTTNRWCLPPLRWISRCR